MVIDLMTRKVSLFPCLHCGIGDSVFSVQFDLSQGRVFICKYIITSGYSVLSSVRLGLYWNIDHLVLLYALRSRLCLCAFFPHLKYFSQIQSSGTYGAWDHVYSACPTFVHWASASQEPQWFVPSMNTCRFISRPRPCPLQTFKLHCVCHITDMLFLFPHKSISGVLELACMTAASR